jgi:hypothetical protein
MAGLRFAGLQSRPMEFLDFTSLTLDEFQLLVPPFEAAFQTRMAVWRMDGKPRTARRIGKLKVFLPRCLRERTPGTLPRGLSGASVSRCLRLQGDALAVASSQRHGGCGACHLACLVARLLLAEVWS